jgi:hypothetical protein
MDETNNQSSHKPLGFQNYGSIPHLPNSRLGKAKHHIEPGQAHIATKKARDFKDLIIVQEKLDGANVGVAKKNGELIPLTRSGHDCRLSPYPLHHLFVKFMETNAQRFDELLNEGERLCGEWLLVAHGTMYQVPHEPFVAFDLFDNQNKRIIYHDFLHRVLPFDFVVPRLLHLGQPISVEKILLKLDADSSKHGALEEIEGAIWRVERSEKVDFLCKYVKAQKFDGKYLGDTLVFNQVLTQYHYLFP